MVLSLKVAVLDIICHWNIQSKQSSAVSCNNVIITCLRKWIQMSRHSVSFKQSSAASSLGQNEHLPSFSIPYSCTVNSRCPWHLLSYFGLCVSLKCVFVLLLLILFCALSSCLLSLFYLHTTGFHLGKQDGIHYHTHTFFFPETETCTEATGSHFVWARRLYMQCSQVIGGQLCLENHCSFVGTKTGISADIYLSRPSCLWNEAV